MPGCYPYPAGTRYFFFTIGFISFMASIQFLAIIAVYSGRAFGHFAAGLLSAFMVTFVHGFRPF